MSAARFRSRRGGVLRRDLRFSVFEGIGFSIMVGLGEAYVPAFALASGLSALAAALVATLPMVAGAAAQLVSPYAVRRLGSNRRWVVGCAAVQAASFPLLVAMALTGRVTNLALFSVMTLYWAAGMATGPAWNTWMGALVPRRVRAPYFARRSRWLYGATLIGLLLGGVVLEVGVPRHGVVVFAGLFAVAGLARVASAYGLSRQSEPGDPWHGPERRARPVDVIGTARSWGPDALRLLFFLLGMHLAVHMSAPYFTPYMLDELALPYGAFAALTATSFVARIGALPGFGHIAHRRGSRFVLALGGIGIAPLPMLWLLSSDLRYLIVVQVISGVAWGAFELATTLAFFERIPDHRRTTVLTLFNLANALTIAGAAALGGLVFELAGGGASGGSAYGTLFIVSVLARFAVLATIAALPTVVMENVWIPLRALAVRPSGGGVDRPVLPGLVPAPTASVGAGASRPSAEDRGPDVAVK